MSKYEIQYQKLHDNAVLPARGTEGSAGYDLTSLEKHVLEPGLTIAIPLGFATSMPSSIHGRIESRSGMALQDMVVLTGVIDSDYRGEWKVILKNCGSLTKEIAAGQRIAQVVFRPTITASFIASEELTETSRGAGGFGSTGTGQNI